MEYTKDRDRDFLKAYRREMRRAWARKETIESQELIRRAIEGGAPGFYVGFECARRRVSARLRRRLRNRHREQIRSKRMLWDDLTDRVESELSGVGRRRLKLPEALARVLAKGNAPQFYIEPRTARRILFETRNNKIEKNKGND